jgi:hypothetical protein
MTIIPFAELTTSRQKAILAISAMRRRSDRAMQNAQADYGTQSPQFAEAAARYEQATEMLNEQTQRTRIPEHPLYAPAESAAAYHDAFKKDPAQRCGKCGAWLHETEQMHGCIMCQAKEAK